MQRYKMFLVGTFGLIAVVSGFALAEEKPLKAFAVKAPPFYILDDAGKWSGIYVDVIQALAEEAGYQVVFEELPWARGLKYLETGEIDIMSGLSKSSEREKVMHFLGVHGYEQEVIVVKKENAPHIQLQTLDDFAKEGYVWGIGLKNFYSDEFNARLDNDAAFKAHFEEVSGDASNLKKVKFDRIIGCFKDRVTIGNVLKTSPEFSDLTVITTPFFPPAPIYIGASKKISPEKLAKLQAAYDSLNQQGKFEAIVKKWTE